MDTDTNKEILNSDEPEASVAPARPEKKKRSGQKSVLQQRLRHELDTFNFSALIEGVSTMKPAEETPAPRAVEIQLAAPLRAEDPSAATLAREPEWEQIASAAPANTATAGNGAGTPASFPGFDLDPRRSSPSPFARAKGALHATAPASYAAPRRQVAHPAPQFEHPGVNTQRKIVRGQRRRRLNVSLLALVTALLMLAVGVAAALKWRAHPVLPVARAASRRQQKGGGHLVPSALHAAAPASYHRFRHHRRRRHKE